MQTKFVAAALIVGASLPALSQPTDTFDFAASCSRVTAENKCVLGVDIAMTKRFLIVSALRERNGTWEVEAILLSRKHQANPTLLKDSELYGVHLCDERSITGDCLQSSVFWAPTLTESEKLPNRVVVSQGNGKAPSTEIDRDLPPQGQIIQYNVYMMTNKLNESIGADFPPMTPVVEGETIDHQDTGHLIHYNVYNQYSAFREHHPVSAF